MHTIEHPKYLWKNFRTKRYDKEKAKWIMLIAGLWIFIAGLAFFGFYVQAIHHFNPMDAEQSCRSATATGVITLMAAGVCIIYFFIAKDKMDECRETEKRFEEKAPLLKKLLCPGINDRPFFDKDNDDYYSPYRLKNLAHEKLAALAYKCRTAKANLPAGEADSGTATGEASDATRIYFEAKKDFSDAFDLCIEFKLAAEEDAKIPLYNEALAMYLE